MNKTLLSLTTSALLVAQSAQAGIIAIPPSVTGVPVDSPWLIGGLVATLAVIGARILHNRRK